MQRWMRMPSSHGYAVGQKMSPLILISMGTSTPENITDCNTFSSIMISLDSLGTWSPSCSKQHATDILVAVERSHEWQQRGKVLGCQCLKTGILERWCLLSCHQAIQSKTFSSPICQAMLNQDHQVALSNFLNSDSIVIRKFSLRLLLLDECPVPEEDFYQLITQKVFYTELIRSHSRKSASIRHKLKTKIPDVYGFCVDAMCHTVSTICPSPTLTDDHAIHNLLQIWSARGHKIGFLVYPTKEDIGQRFHGNNATHQMAQQMLAPEALAIIGPWECKTFIWRTSPTTLLTSSNSCPAPSLASITSNSHTWCMWNLFVGPDFNHENFFAQMLARILMIQQVLLNFLDFGENFRGSQSVPAFQSILACVHPGRCKFPRMNSQMKKSQAFVSTDSSKRKSLFPLEKRKDNSQARISRINDALAKRHAASKNFLPFSASLPIKCPPQLFFSNCMANALLIQLWLLHPPFDPGELLF